MPLNVITSIDDFAKYVKISIDTKGYDESWIGGNNLLVCYGIVGKVSKNSNVIPH